MNTIILSSVPNHIIITRVILKVYLLVLLEELACSFCKPSKKRSPYVVAVLSYLILCGLNLILFNIIGYETIFKISPFSIFIPLVFITYIRSESKFTWCFTSIFLSLLVSYPAHWIADLIRILPIGTFWGDISEFVTSIPLFLLCRKYLSKYIKRLADIPIKAGFLFCLLPCAFFIYVYFFKITVLSANQNIITPITIIPSLSCIVYLISLILLSNFFEKSNQEHFDNEYMSIQLKQTEINIKKLKESNSKAKEYRHDLRHHLQFTLSLLSNDKCDEAMSYLQGLLDEINTGAPVIYCNNESADLIYAHFAEICKEKKITFTVDCPICPFETVEAKDFCALLFNALDNAVNAASEPTNEADRFIKCRSFEKNGHFFLSISNSYLTPPVVNSETKDFISQKGSGHGYGTTSIRHIVEKYSGITKSSFADNVFTLMISF